MISQRQLFLSHIAQTSHAPLMLEIERAEGVYLYTPDGKKYIDLIAGISVSNLGHCHPEVVEAICRQVSRYMHVMVYGECVYTPQVALAKLLTEHLPPTLNNIYFVNSGAEAVEGALKLAKRYTRRSELVAFRNAYHGSTNGAMSIMGSDFFTQAYRPLLPNTKHIEYNNIADLSKITTRTACVVVEPLQAEAGILLPKPDFFKQLRQRCTEVGALLILDEIQTGYGRTGTLFAFEQLGIIPDILLTAKGMGGGLPLGAFITSRPIMSVLQHNPILGHITTFGGNPVSCTASLATLQVLLRENYIAEVPQKEAIFKQFLQHKHIKDVRSHGLLMAVELDGGFDFLLKTVHQCIKRGLLTDWFLFSENSLRIAPPLIITQKQIENACTIILESLKD